MVGTLQRLRRGLMPCLAMSSLALAGSGCKIEEHPGWIGSGSDASTSSGSGSSTASTGTGGTTGSDAGSASSSGSSTATSTSTGGAVCGDGMLEMGEECDGTDVGGVACTDLGFDGGSLTCGPGCAFDTSGCSGTVTEQRIFITTTTFKGDFGDLAAVDAACQAAADGASLGGTWLAVVSTSTVNAKDHVVVTGLVKNLAGFTVANDANDLWSGSLNFPVGFNENGAPSFGTTMTGTNPDGTFSGDACNDFTTAQGASVTEGQAINGGGGWIANGTSNCNQPKALYCMEQ